MKDRRNTGRLTARAALGVATAVGIAAGAVGVLGTDTASAHPVSLTLNYTCSVSRFSRSVPMQIHSDIPDAVAAGRPSPKFAFDATTTVSKIETLLIHTALGDLKSIGGSADANTELRSPDGDFGVPVHLGINKVTVPDSDRAFAIRATGTAPSHTFHRSGTGRIAVGDLTLHLVGLKANGQRVGAVTVECKLDAPTHPVVASFEITGTGKATGSPASGTPGAGTTAGSASAGTSAAPTPTSSSTARSTIANTGQDAKDPMLLAVGTLVAGGGLFLLGSRRKRRRAGADG